MSSFRSLFRFRNGTAPVDSGSSSDGGSLTEDANSLDNNPSVENEEESSESAEEDVDEDSESDDEDVEETEAPNETEEAPTAAEEFDDNVSDAELDERDEDTDEAESAGAAVAPRIRADGVFEVGDRIKVRSTGEFGTVARIQEAKNGTRIHFYLDGSDETNWRTPKNLELCDDDDDDEEE